ncbi:hypothetical protein [Thermococcus sp. GR6]|uniref:hypothetical protein n=1 Tax=Thermococcus sp. GR6 TaxID=1638256 RepID=UPI001431956A|nr:hypothetical protein [Thermococcus sp. GR6]NJE43318.1 hypothetical protein [Thermococcus sp. GR6]
MIPLIALFLWPFLWFIVRVAYHRLSLGSWPDRRSTVLFLAVSLLSTALGILHFIALFGGGIYVALLLLILWAVTLGWIVPKADNRRMLELGLYGEEASPGKLQELMGVGLVALFASYVLGFVVFGSFSGGM